MLIDISKNIPFLESSLPFFPSGNWSMWRFTLWGDPLPHRVLGCKYKEVVGHLGISTWGLLKTTPFLHTFVKSCHLANGRTHFRGHPSWNFELLLHKATLVIHILGPYLILSGGFCLMITKHSGYINYLMRCLWVLQFVL